MAKKKRSAALFEVMVKQEQRRLPRPPGMFRTLYLWFKNRPKAAQMAMVDSVVARVEVVHTAGGAGDWFYDYIPGVGSFVACCVGGFGVSTISDIAWAEGCSTAFAASGVVS